MRVMARDLWVLGALWVVGCSTAEVAPPLALPPADSASDTAGAGTDTADTVDTAGSDTDTEDTETAAVDSSEDTGADTDSAVVDTGVDTAGDCATLTTQNQQDGVQVYTNGCVEVTLPPYIVNQGSGIVSIAPATTGQPCVDCGEGVTASYAFSCAGISGELAFSADKYYSTASFSNASGDCPMVIQFQGPGNDQIVVKVQ